MAQNSNTPKKMLIDYVPLVLSIFAFLFSLYQFFYYRDIEKQLKELNAESLQLSNDLKRAELAETEFRQRVQFENRYLVASGEGIITILDYDEPDNNFIDSVIKNKVLEDFDSHIRASTGDLPEQFYFSAYFDGNTQAKHGLVVLRVHNTSSNKANNVKIMVKWKDFPNTTTDELLTTSSTYNLREVLDNNGNSFVNLWELRDNNEDWTTESISIADIPPGGEIIIPLAHVLGTNYYFGRVIMPEHLEWDNPLLGKQENMTVGNMVPTDQWLYQSEFGGNFYVAQ